MSDVKDGDAAPVQNDGNLTEDDVEEHRRLVRERRLRDRMEAAIRARRFTAEETMRMGFELSFFALSFGDEVKNA